MKKLLLLFSIVLFSGSDIYDRYQSVPIFMFRVDLEKSVQLVPTPVPIREPGSIYMYQTWLLLVEQYKGIHLIDNTDPANPIRKGFLKVPGCRSLAVGNGTLYVDNAVDLVGVRINLTSLECVEVARSRRALPEILNPEGSIPWAFSRANRPEDSEIVGWISKNDEL
jgi:hypothetical protein